MALYIDDRELIAAHRAGDSGAFNEIVREHRGSLVRHARRKLLCDAAAEDALQETFVRAYRALPRFEGDYRLGPWLHRIMSNVCLDEITRRRRDGEKFDKAAARPSVEFTAPSVEDELGLGTDYSAINEALNEIPDSYSEALRLRFIEDLEYSQVAEVTGVTEQNARARVSRARGLMRASLKGLAVAPVLLFGMLRRGEKAAAAATSGAGVAVPSIGSLTSNATQVASSAVPAITETAMSVSQVAPAVVPAIAKAAMAVGITAAVLTPTSDSAVHQAVSDVLNKPVPTEIIQMEQATDVSIVIADNGTGLSDESKLSSDASLVVEPRVVNAAPVQAPIRPQASDGVNNLTPGERTVGRTPEIVASSNQVLILDSLLTEVLTLHDQGAGRYGLSGVALSLEEIKSSQIIIDPRSSLWIAVDQTALGERRFQIEMLGHQSDGSALTLRIAGYALEESFGFSLKGVASLAHPSRPEAQIVNVTGSLNLDPGNESAHFSFDS